MKFIVLDECNAFIIVAMLIFYWLKATKAEKNNVAA